MKKIIIATILVISGIFLIFDSIKAKDIIIEQKIIFDIKGAVNKPGTYEIEDGKRVEDAIFKAGGLRFDADTRYINLSRQVTNEMVIIIYTIDEVNNTDNNTMIKYLEKECHCPEIKNDGCVSDNVADNKTELVSLNNGSLEQLMTLPGIGEAKAKLIIEYRNKTPFTNIEQIKNIKGIGDATYNKLKAYLTL